MLCKRCGTVVPDGMLFCTRCGNSMSDNNLNGNSHSQNEFDNMSYSDQSSNVNMNQHISGQHYENWQTDGQYAGNQQYGRQYYENQQPGGQYYDNQSYVPNNGVNPGFSGSINNGLNYKKKRHLFVGGIISIFVLIIIAGGIITTLLLVNNDKGRSSNEVVRCFVEAINTYDVNKMMSIIPEQLVTYSINSGEYSSLKDARDEMREYIEELREEMENEFGNNARLVYRIISEDNSRGSSSLKEINEAIEDEYGINLHINDVKKVKVELSVSKRSSEDDSVQLWLAMIKIKDSWYLLTLYPYYDYDSYQNNSPLDNIYVFYNTNEYRYWISNTLYTGGRKYVV